MGKRSIENDLDDLGDEVLGDLDTPERIRLLVKAEAEGNDEHVERLVESVPRRTYETQDLGYQNAAKGLYLLSTHAAHRVEKAYKQIESAERARDRDTALMLLSKAVGFERETDHDEVVEDLTELYDELPIHIQKPDYVELLAYMAQDTYSSTILDDLDETTDEWDEDEGPPVEVEESGDMFLESPEEAVFPAEPVMKDVRVTMAYVEFYQAFHGVRILAEEYLGVTFDEFIGFSPVGNVPISGTGRHLYDEEFCRNVLELNDEYLDFVDEALNDDDVPMKSLDEGARAWAEDAVREWGDEAPLFKKTPDDDVAAGSDV